MKCSPWSPLLALLAMPLLTQADGDVIVKGGGSIRIHPGSALIVGPNQLVDVQSGAKATVLESSEIDGNVVVRAGGTLVLCGTITGSLLNQGSLKDCLPRPDALIGPKKNSLRGNGRYSATGAGQRLSIHLGRRKSSSFVIGGQNDGALEAGLRFRTFSAGGSPRYSVKQISGPRLNVTATMARGGYLRPDVLPGQIILFQVAVRAGAPSQRTRPLRLSADVIAQSDAGLRDRATAEITPPQVEKPPVAPIAPTRPLAPRGVL